MWQGREVAAGARWAEGGGCRACACAAGVASCVRAPCSCDIAGNTSLSVTIHYHNSVLYASMLEMFANTFVNLHLHSSRYFLRPRSIEVHMEGQFLSCKMICEFVCRVSQLESTEAAARAPAACCPHCEPRYRCRHQEMHHVTFRSGERWLYQCQICECLVST